jgi:hypothetical protein
MQIDGGTGKGESRMKQLGRSSGAWIGVLLTALGCGGSADEGMQIGGETNWLATCNADSDCSVGQCLCNVCTISCAESAACSAGPPQSSCVAQSELPTSCAQQLSAGLCLASDTQVGLSSAELPSPVTRLDETLALFLRDLEAQPEEAQPFTRYFSIANSITAGPETGLSTSPLAIERGRSGLSKLVNSLSSLAVATAPSSIDPDGVFYRIDLRSYGWDRPITVDGVPYTDGWEAIVGHASLAVEYRGPAADPLARRSGTSQPWLFGDDFVATAAAGNLYYELLGVPNTLAELQQQLGESQSPSPQRAAFENSGYSMHARVVERRELASGRTSWQAYNFGSEERGLAVFSAPLDFVPDATEVIFELPNGLNGFFLANEQGERSPTSQLSREAAMDPAQLDGNVRAGVSCFSCHNGGLITFTDQLRDVWLPAGPAAVEPQLVLDAYPPASELSEALTTDAAAYSAALEQAGVARAPDGVSRLYLDFYAGLVDQARAAEELFTTPETLTTEMLRLPGSLFPLGGATRTLPREVFLRSYRDGLCVLHENALNKPVGCP